MARMEKIILQALILLSLVGEAGVEGFWCPSGCSCRHLERWNCRWGTLVEAEWEGVALPRFLDVSRAVGVDFLRLGCQQWEGVRYLALLRSPVACSDVEERLPKCGVEVPTFSKAKTIAETYIISKISKKVPLGTSGKWVFLVTLR